MPHPWEASYPPECRWDTPIPTTTLPAFLDSIAARHANRPALEYNGRTLTYAELKHRADRLAAGLLQQGITHTDCVALLLPNTPWHPIAFFAALRAGARVVHLSALDARRELAFKLRDSGATLLITTDLGPLPATALALHEEGAAPRLLLAPDARWGGEATEPDPRFGQLPDADPPPSWPAVAPDDVALLQYTGGTTGTPKGAILTHANLTAAIAIYSAWRDLTTPPEGTARVLLVLPLFHIFALTAVLLHQLDQGSLIHLRPRFDAARTADDIERHRITTLSGVPTIWIALLNFPGVEARDLSSLRQCSSGGAPMPQEVAERLERLIGTRIRGGWGMTETCPAGTRIPHDAPRYPGLIGLPLPGIELRVVCLDDPTHALPPGETGEIAIRGPNVFRGYWKRDDETKHAFVDGWFLTGDIGWMDEAGFFTLVDRRKNMILSGGFNVYPTQVEAAIYEHPDVAECIVIGVPDEYRGQSAKAYVALKPGAAPFTLEDLRAFLADRLGRHELPAALEIRDNLPRSAAGKLLASALKSEPGGS